MSLEQAAVFGETASKHAAQNEIFPAIENLDRGIAILEKHLTRSLSSSSPSSSSSPFTDIEKVELRARLFDFLSRKADLLLVSGGTSAALNTALMMCSTDPRNPDGFFVAGQALRKLKKYDQAVDYLTTASKLDPKNNSIKQTLELAITELRMPSTVEVLNSSAAMGSSVAATPLRNYASNNNNISSSSSSANNGNNSDEFDFDIDSILRFAQQYVPSAKQLKQQAREKPAQAAGVVLGILVLLMFLISFETVMFCLCFGIVIAVHKWEKKTCARRGLISYRVPVLDVPLNVLTSAFLAISAMYFLLM